MKTHTFQKFLWLCLLLISVMSHAEEVPAEQWMPDAALRAAVQEELGLPPATPLTKEHMLSLERLVANHKGIIDITGLEFATSLRALHLGGRNRITDLHPLANLTNLTQLHVWHRPVAGMPPVTNLDISPLAGLINLETLSLEKNGISDISPLARLKKLRKLHLSDNDIEDLRPLAALTELQTLSIEGNLITDLRPLASLINLEVLSLENTQVSDISPLAALTNLQTLDISNNLIEDLRPLAGLTELRTLWIQGNPITDFTPLAGLNLTDLKYDVVDAPTGQTDPSEAWMPDAALRAAVRGEIGLLPGVPLTKEKIPMLESLSVRGKGISDLTGLEFATHLRDLNIGQNPITDLGPLSNLTRLVELHFWHYPINPTNLNLRPLASLINLEVLSLEGHWISDIRPLVGLKNLHRLALTNNQINDTSPLTALTELWQLWIAGNLVTDLTPLSGMNLRDLNISNNPITDVRPLATLINLEVLFLENTQVSDISPLVGLTQLRTLRIGGYQTIDLSPLSELTLTEFQYDEICEILPPGPPVTDRIQTKNYPATYQPRSHVAETPEEYALNYPSADTDPELYHKRIARNDLYFTNFFTLDWVTDTPPYSGLGTRVGGDLELARAWRETQLALNPNLVFLVQVPVQDRPRVSEFPPDSDVWLRHPDGQFVRSGDYTFNILRPEVQQLLIDRIVGVAECGLFDGVFLDGFFLNGTVGWDKLYEELSTFAGREITGEDIIEIYRHIFRGVRERVHPDFLIILNTAVTRPDRYTEFINGSHMETDVHHLTTREGLLQIEEVLSWNEANLRAPQINCLEGKALDGGSYSPENLRRMRLITTLSLTHSNGYVDYLIHLYEGATGPRLYPWYTFWDADLGQPVGEKRQLYENREGLFIREFTNGWTVYNRSGQAQDIQLSENVSGWASGMQNKRWHTVPDLDGEIFLKNIAPPVDVNADGVINILDLVLVANGFGNAEPDINGDGIVNILDLVVVANAFQ